MTISSTTRIAGPFTGNGVTTTFPFTYKVFSTADVQVIRLTISTGLETTLTIVTDYTITLNGDQDSNPGGNIVLVTPLLALYTLTATSDIANLQPTDLTNQGGFYPEVITDALDRATIQIQQLADQTDRAIKIPISDGVLDMTTPVVADRLGKYLAFDSLGLPVASVGTGNDSALRTDLANATAVSAGSRLSGFRQTGTGATARTVDDKLKDTVSVKDFGAVGDGVTDDAAAIQSAIDFVKTQTGGIVFFPAGRYRIVTRLKLQNTYASNICIKLCGVGNGNSNVSASSTRGSLIIGETALTSQMMVEMSGGSNITFEDIGLYAGTTNPSTIGIYLQRVQATGNGYCAHNNFTRISIGMGTNPTANGNVGTIAILNKRGEHHYHNECRYTADTPLILAGVKGADTAYSPTDSPSILSPDYVESYTGGATMGLNSLTNCLLIAYSNNTVEAYAPSNCSWSNCYFLVADGKAGMYMQYAKTITVNNALVEYTGAGTSLAFMRLQGDCRGINVSALTNLTNYALIKTIDGTSLGNSTINAIGVWGSVFDHATESGGYLYGSTVSLDSLLGSSVPTAGLVNCVVLDGNDVANQNADFRFVSTPTSFATGYGAVTAATDGNDTITSQTTTYISEINITASKTVNTALVLVGTAGAGNYKIYLIDLQGNVVAQTASFAVAVTGQFIGNNFSTSYFAKGPGKYFLAVQCDNAASANRIRTFPVGAFGAVARTGITYGSLANNAANAPSSFAANVSPIALIY